MIDKAKVALQHFGFKKIFWCFLLVAIILVSIVSIFPNNDDVSINNDTNIPFNKGWMLENTGEVIELPYVLKNAKNNTVTLSKLLPDVFPQSAPTLSFHSSLQTLMVEVGDHVIYTYNQQPDAYFDVQPPPAWHLINLEPEMAGQMLSITYSSPYAHYAGVLNNIELGEKYANVSNFVGSRLFSMALCLIIFTFGLFAIIICLFAHNKITNLNQLLYLGIASLLISLWSICETKALQIIIGNVQTIMFVTFLSIMLFPIALLLFFRENFTGKIRTLYNIFIGSFSLYFVTIVLLQIFNVANFNDYFPFLLVLIGLMLILILYSLISAYCKNRTMQNCLPMIAVFFLLVFSMIDMYRYFFQKLALTSYSDTSSFARVGMLIMLLILGYSSIRKILMYYTENSKAEVYKALSQTDSMSGLKNRAYLAEIYPTVLQNAAKRKKPFSVIMVDIDNFKNYNDHYGHSAGDKVIQMVADALQTEAEKLLGTTIRYGGEEFLVVLPQGDTKAAVAVAENIKANIGTKKISHKYSTTASIITVSQGIYSAVPTLEDSIEYFIDCSDRAMYRVKKGSKNGYAIY